MPAQLSPGGSLLVVQPVAAACAATLLVAVAAIGSPGGSLSTLGQARREASALRGSGAALALWALGVVVGIPLALGIIPGSSLSLVAALLAVFGARLALREPGSGWSGYLQAGGWLVVIAWCVLAVSARFGTLDLGSALAFQAVTGAGPLHGPPAAAATTFLAGITGLVAAAMWLSSLASPPGAGSLDRVMRWGECALAAAAVAGPAWGPSVGSLLLGPATPAALGAAGASMAVTILCVLALSQRCPDENRRVWALPAAALTALAALGTAVVR